VPREWTRSRSGRVAVSKPSSGLFIRRAGDDWAAGEEVLAAGAVLTPGRVALAASCGAADLEVRRRPRVAILATGDELVEPGAALRPGAIRESNRLLLAGLVREAGGEPEVFAIVPDEREATERAIAGALERHDVVVTSGGASVGEKDFVAAALARIGAPPRFHGVAVKPGKPLAFATRERPGGAAPVAIFALPGNPASAFVSFHLFVGPALRRLSGRRDLEPLALEAAAAASLDAGASSRRTYVRGQVRVRGGALVAAPLARQASGSVRSLAEANALIVLDPGARVERGAPVRVEPIGPAFAEDAA
jgi:molybdopterin molybdotransferase